MSFFVFLQINYGHIANTATKQTVQFACTPHTSSLQPLALLPSGGELVMMELMTGKKLKSLHGHYGSVNCVAGHPVEQVWTGIVAGDFIHNQ